VKYILSILALMILTSVANAEPRKAYGFKANWCPACARMYPIWGRMGIEIVDTDVSDLDEKYGVEVLPSTVIVKDGKVIKILPGVVTAAEIRQYLRQ
jgi:thioredoxin-like negative regulator of GroEL